MWKNRLYQNDKSKIAHGQWQLTVYMRDHQYGSFCPRNLKYRIYRLVGQSAEIPPNVDGAAFVSVVSEEYVNKYNLKPADLFHVCVCRCKSHRYMGMDSSIAAIQKHYQARGLNNLNDVRID